MSTSYPDPTELKAAAERLLQQQSEQHGEEPSDLLTDLLGLRRQQLAEVIQELLQNRGIPEAEASAYRDALLRRLKPDPKNPVRDTLRRTLKAAAEKAQAFGVLTYACSFCHGNKEVSAMDQRTHIPRMARCPVCNGTGRTRIDQRAPSVIAVPVQS